MGPSTILLSALLGWSHVAPSPAPGLVHLPRVNNNSMIYNNNNNHPLLLTANNSALGGYFFFPSVQSLYAAIILKPAQSNNKDLQITATEYEQGATEPRTTDSKSHFWDTMSLSKSRYWDTMSAVTLTTAVIHYLIQLGQT